MFDKREFCIITSVILFKIISKWSIEVVQKVNQIKLPTLKLSQVIIIVFLKKRQIHSTLFKLQCRLTLDRMNFYFYGKLLN